MSETGKHVASWKKIWDHVITYYKDGDTDIAYQNGKRWGFLRFTEQQLAELLLKHPKNENILIKMKELQLAERKEQFEKLKPAWFDYAPKSVKERWEEYKNTDNLEKLQWIHDNVSYNSDHTMNILKLKKTFCEDVSWTGQRCGWEEAKQLATSKWYTLGTDYNNCDSDEVKHDSDWYKVINIFSNGNGDTAEAMELFRDITWCNSRYWTATEYKNDKWEKLEGVFRGRGLGESGCGRDWSSTGYNGRVCGFKDSM